MHPKICFQMLSRSGQVMGDYHHFDDQAIDKISPHRTWVHENDLDRYIRVPIVSIKHFAIVT